MEDDILFTYNLYAVNMHSVRISLQVDMYSVWLQYRTNGKYHSLIYDSLQNLFTHTQSELNAEQVLIIFPVCI